MTAAEQREMERFRRDNFALKVEPIRLSTYAEPGEVSLSITHNGHQWQNIDLTPIERLAVIKALLME